MNRVAVFLWTLILVLVLASTAMSAGRDVASDLVLYAVLPLNLATVGALVVSRAGGNRVGWLFLGLGLYVAVAELVEGYGLLAADTGWSDGQVGAWSGTWVWVGEMAAWTAIVALFPDGRLSGRRWRWVLWGATLGALLAVTGMAFGTWANPEFAPDQNPFLVDHVVVELCFPVGMLLLAGSLAGAAVSLVQRMRQATGVERQQLKWFVFAACVVAVVAPFVVALWNVVPGVAVVIAVVVNLIPVATGIAILRYRLYDVDLVIKRTLVYTALTVVLLATYVVLVLVLQVVLNPVVPRDSDLAVAASTLAVAALFRPVRAALQRGVDRRFFRSRYDAARTLQDFADRLRQEVDLPTTTSDLRDVVREAMQPEHVSLWLRRESPDRHQPALHGNDSRTPGP
ncbi:hypothetical protein [Nocardioides sp. GXQ0305]|uniref:hypothetical protein n=1 Tax=Nocardioides sp. GXQ0305 TaxID=3423912 RepID=UPI003D7DF337